MSGKKAVMALAETAEPVDEITLLRKAEAGDVDARRAVEGVYSAGLIEFLRLWVMDDAGLEAILPAVWNDVWGGVAKAFLRRDRESFLEWIQERSAVWVVHDALAFVTVNTTNTMDTQPGRICSVTGAPAIQAGFAAQKLDQLRDAHPDLYVVEAGKGDEAAWAGLHRAFNRPLMGYAQAFGLSHHRTEEAVMEAWERVVGTLARYDRRQSSFYWWIRELARRAALKKRRQDGTRFPEPEPSEPQRPTAEPTELLLKVYDLLHRLTFRCGGYPHQVVAFGFSQLLHGKPTKETGRPRLGAKRKRALEGSPQQVVADHSDKPLEKLSEEFLGCYRRASGLPDDRIEAGFMPTRTRLGLTMGELFGTGAGAGRGSATNPANSGPLNVDRQVGSTRLRDYYGRKTAPEKSVTDWCNRVRDKLRLTLGIAGVGTASRQRAAAVWHELGEEGAERESLRPQGCRRCKLLRVDPCAAVFEETGEITEI